MNKCHFMGRLVRDPEIRYTQSDQPVAHYTLAVDRRIMREGEPSADYLDFVVYGKAAEFAESKRASEGEPAAGNNDFMQIPDGEHGELPFN